MCKNVCIPQGWNVKQQTLKQVCSFYLIISFKALKNRPGVRLAWRKRVNTIHCKPLVALENSACWGPHKTIVVFVALERQSQWLLACRLHSLSHSWQVLVPESLEAKLRRKFLKSPHKLLRWYWFALYYHIERGCRLACSSCWSAWHHAWLLTIAIPQYSPADVSLYIAHCFPPSKKFLFFSQRTHYPRFPRVNDLH